MGIEEVEEIFYKTLLTVFRLYEDEAVYTFKPFKGLDNVSFYLNIKQHQIISESNLHLKYFRNTGKFNLHFATSTSEKLSERTETIFNASANSIKSLIENFFGDLLCNADLILDWENGGIKFI